MNNTKSTTKDKIIKTIIGIIAGIMISISIINSLFLCLHITNSSSMEEMSVFLIRLSLSIINIIFVVIICINYKKWKISLTILLLAILILAFIIPIKKVEEWRMISDQNSLEILTFPTRYEKYKLYYNIYGMEILQIPTGERSTWGTKRGLQQLS